MRAGGGVLWGESIAKRGVRSRRLRWPRHDDRRRRLRDWAAARMAVAEVRPGLRQPDLGRTSSPPTAHVVTAAAGERRPLLRLARGQRQLRRRHVVRVRTASDGADAAAGIIGYDMDRVAEHLAGGAIPRKRTLTTGTDAVVLVAPPRRFVPQHLSAPAGPRGFSLCGRHRRRGWNERCARSTRPNTPDFDLMEPTPYTGLQAMMDPFGPPGWPNYHRRLPLSGWGSAIDV